MTPEAILEPIVKQKLASVKSQGKSYKLKSKPKKLAIKLIPHMAFFILGLIGFAEGGLIICAIAIALGIRKVMKTNDTAILLELAKSNPKMTIDQLIAQEVVVK